MIIVRLLPCWFWKPLQKTPAPRKPLVKSRNLISHNVHFWSWLLSASPSNLIHSSSSSNGIASVNLFQIRLVQLTIIPEIDWDYNTCKRGRTIISTGNKGENKSIRQLQQNQEHPDTQAQDDHHHHFCCVVIILTTTTVLIRDNSRHQTTYKSMTAQYHHLGQASQSRIQFTASHVVRAKR